MKLRLEPFEHLMYADDRPHQPMTFWLRATLLGTIARPRLEAALLRSLSRQPLLSARLCGEPTAKTAALYWDIGMGSLPPLDFGLEGQPCQFPENLAAIDLRRESALRVFIRQGPRQVTLSLQFHHAAVDALAAAQFLDDVLSCYDDPARSDGALSPLQLERLVARGSFQLTASDKRRRLFQDLARTFLFFRKIPKPLLIRRDAKQFDDEQYPAAVGRELPATELTALRNGAGKSHATVNDVMLRDLFLTLDDWNRAHGRRQAVRLAMPINMRRTGDDQMPAANVGSICFLDRAPSEFNDETRLLRGVVRETAFIKGYAMGHALIMVATLAGKFRSGMRWLMTPRLLWRCSASAVLSNLGTPLKNSKLKRNARGELLAGGLTLTQLELLPPIRPGTSLAVGVVTYAGRASMTFHYDQTQLEATEAEALAGSFHGRLKSSMIAPEPGDSLLERLVKEHSLRRKGASAFYGLPIGKHVDPTPKLRELPEPLKAGAASGTLRHDEL